MTTVSLTGNEIINNVQGVSSNGYPAATTQNVTLTQLTNFEGDLYLAAINNAVSTTTMTPITFTSPVTGNSSFSVVAGGVYIFDIYLSVANNAAGGLKLAFGGTSTATLLSADTWAYNTTTVAAQSNITSLASNLVAYTGAVTTINITGTFVPATAGTFLLQFAQNVSTTATTSINAGSNFWMDRIG